MFAKRSVVGGSESQYPPGFGELTVEPVDPNKKSDFKIKNLGAIETDRKRQAAILEEMRI
jgi:hypothetical protein